MLHLQLIDLFLASCLNVLLYFILEEHREKVKKAKAEQRNKAKNRVSTVTAGSRSVILTLRRSCWGQCRISINSVCMKLIIYNTMHCCVFIEIKYLKMFIWASNFMMKSVLRNWNTFFKTLFIINQVVIEKLKHLARFS